MKMKNVVFDFGQVLVRFDPAYIVAQYVRDPADAALLEEVVFDRLYWDRMDAGTMTDDELMTLARGRLPGRLWEIAGTIYYNWIYHLPEIDGMRELIISLKEEYGVSVYLLSNISCLFAAHAKEIPILSLLDGCVFSAVCKMVKPNGEIFRHLCDTFAIEPSESVFVDDRQDNIEGARGEGFVGYCFDGDAARLRAYLDGILKK